MNWFQKIIFTKCAATLRTEDLHIKIAQSISYVCGGNWVATTPYPWTEKLENIMKDKNLSDIHNQARFSLGNDVGYSTSFWVQCKEGDPFFHEKWGVSVNFTVTSGASNTVFDSEHGDWDLVISANVQRAHKTSWTPATPYPLFMESVGHRENMRTIVEVAEFVKESIWRNQSGDTDDDNEDDNGDDSGYDGLPSGGMGLKHQLVSV